jgi:hypothetical protein
MPATPRDFYRLQAADRICAHHRPMENVCKSAASPFGLPTCSPSRLVSAFALVLMLIAILAVVTI